MIEVFDFFSIKGFYYNKLNIIHQFIRNCGKILKMNLQSFGYRNSNVSKIKKNLHDCESSGDFYYIKTILTS